jgi:hypothetical protein
VDLNEFIMSNVFVGDLGLYPTICHIEICKRSDQKIRYATVRILLPPACSYRNLLTINHVLNSIHPLTHNVRAKDIDLMSIFQNALTATSEVAHNFYQFYTTRFRLHYIPLDDCMCICTYDRNCGISDEIYEVLCLQAKCNVIIGPVWRHTFTLGFNATKSNNSPANDKDPVKVNVRLTYFTHEFLKEYVPLSPGASWSKSLDGSGLLTDRYDFKHYQEVYDLLFGGK